MIEKIGARWYVTIAAIFIGLMMLKSNVDTKLENFDGACSRETLKTPTMDWKKTEKPGKYGKP
ncbi:MAG: hypothetical protein PV340_05320 [Wolbachia sp.]|nr:hypothetical protein [Wolbachia sp.]MDD9336778.1 hypothetical protein [Wolbachia sp.]